jgi:hypothetical protein
MNRTTRVKMSVLLSLDAIFAIVLQGVFVYEKMLFFSWYSLQDPGIRRIRFEM